MDLEVNGLFLDTEEDKDDFRFLAPARKDALIKTYIDGINTFKAMETEIAAAKESVYLTFWMFDVAIPLFGPTKGPGARTWGDMLFNAAKGGVDVRLILSDFDAIAQIGYHRQIWRMYRKLMERRDKLDAGKRDRLQVICSLHDATISGALDPFINKTWAGKLQAIVAGLNESPTSYGEKPGVWNNVEFIKAKSKFRAVKKPEFTVSPASHHQKTCVVDGRIAFVGGLDVVGGRVDLQTHPGDISGFPGNGWHDVQCSVEGEPVADVARNFVGRWNRERLLFEKFVKDANALGRGHSLRTLITTPIAAVPAAAAPRAGNARAQVHRTLSIDGGLGLRSPDTVRQDIKNIYENAIGSAERYIYIENQYLRATTIGDWIIDRKKKVPGLQVIIVLPVAPEEVGYDKTVDPVTLEGIALQHGLLTRLKGKLKGDLGLYSMVKRARASKPKGDNEKPSTHTQSCRSDMILVHSKVMIIDDVFATVGSANANLRSFRVDTEMNLSWLDAGSATKLRLDLWKEMLGSPKGIADWPVSEYVKRWNGIAEANCKAGPKNRNGFVVPHDPDRFKGDKSVLIPAEMTELLPAWTEDGTPGSEGVVV